MKKNPCLFVLFIALCTGCGVQQHTKENEPVRVIKLDGLEQVLSGGSDRLRVINFWATWCAPCVKELPYFEKLNADRNEEVEVILISLDFADELENKVIPFVEKKALRSKVMLLDEIDYNAWIDKVDPGWSGAIPATLIVNQKTGERKFLEKELEEDELGHIIDEMIY